MDDIALHLAAQLAWRGGVADKLLSAMRFECGGHIEKSASKYRVKGVGNDE